MWRCLVKKNVRADQVNNVDCENEHRPIVVNNRYKNMKKSIKTWWKSNSYDLM